MIAWWLWADIQDPQSLFSPFGGRRVRQLTTIDDARTIASGRECAVKLLPTRTVDPFVGATMDGAAAPLGVGDPAKPGGRFGACVCVKSRYKALSTTSTGRSS
jgi:hypothetical protein